MWLAPAQAKHLRSIAEELKGGALKLAEPRFKLQQLGFEPALLDASVEALRALHADGWSPTHAAVMIDALAAERDRAERSRDDIELAWTGPDALGTECRDSARVLEELFDRATASVLLVGYNLRPGAHFDALARAARRHPSLRVEVFAHVFVDKHATVTEALAAHDAELRATLAGVPLGQVRAHRPSLALIELARERRFSAHAKCVTVDDRRVLVTSANFSFSAQEKNIELGVALDDPRLAARVRAQFVTLVKRGDMVAHRL
ncbi:MAG: DISARM system phospholipase D-like protein DrmC [Polyangiales bacterium]